MEMTDVHPDWDAFTPSEESREIVLTAREFFASLATSAASGSDTWESLYEQGYTMLGVPEELDGVGSATDLAAVLEEAGRVLLPVPLTVTAAAVQTLLAAGLPLDEATAAPAALAFRAAQGMFAFDGATARTVVVLEGDGDQTRVRRWRSDPGMHQRESRPIDPSRVGAVVQDPGGVEERCVPVSADHLLAAARTCVASDLVGTAGRALDAAVAHALVREQFGRPIGSFQAVKHRLADLHVAIERARSLVVGAAVELESDALSDRARDLSMMAKAAASETCVLAAVVHTQLLGAMGLTAEADTPAEIRRAQHTAGYLGEPSELYARVAAATLEGSHR